MQVSELDDASVVRSLFRHRFGSEPPDHPHHVGLLAADGALVSYVHFTRVGNLMLGGGACVDDRVLRRMPAEERRAIAAAGGPYFVALAWAVRHFAPGTDAIFGYCGDVRAERVDLAVGFAKTAHRHLLVYWTKELPPPERERLIAQAHAVGPF